MKQFFLLLLLAPIAFSSLQGQILGTPVAYFDFANGIPDGFQNTSTSGISHWEYRGPDTVPNNQVASRGSCGASSSTITSLTAANGFVIFDSNYWDDDDNECGGLGTGQDPAPHDASLITSPIDLSASTSAVLTWQQSFKDYQATLTVEVSNDGGSTWTVIYTNTGANTPSAEWKSFNISAQAAGQSDVRIRFHFTGTYYWWQVDDIAIYTPNPNDVMIQNARYTTYNDAALDFIDMQYDSYPSIMIPPFKFTCQSVNIGANTQTGVKLQTKVFRGATQIYSATSPTVTQAPGATNTLSIAGTYSPSNIIDSYKISYSVTQNQDDNNLNDNYDTLDYRITAFTYSRDERVLQDYFVPGAIYQNQVMEVGNIMQSRGNGHLFHSIGVVISDQSIPGTPIYGRVYLMTNDTINGNVNVLLSETEPYLINPMDLCAPGQEKVSTLKLTNPITLTNNELYFVVVGYNPAVGGLLRVGRSGSTPPFSSLVSYPQSNGLFYLLKAPMVRMHVFPAGSVPGCTDPAADNYNPAATVSDNTCHKLGCTDTIACNFNPIADYDDFSCSYPGCNNPQAYNYDPSAGCDDGSCLFSCPGDFTFDGVVNVYDLLSFTSVFGCMENCYTGDLTGDGVVNVYDLLSFSAVFGNFCQ